MKKILPLFICLLVQHVFAQTGLRLQHINVEDGLSQSSVNYIFQDSHGFMWFATGDGLDRYDGKEFIAYKSSFNDTLSLHLKGRNINSHVFEDRNNKLWLCTDAGISYMDCRHGRSKIVTNKNKQPLYAVVVAADDRFLWCIQAQTGIYAVDLNSASYGLYPFTDKWQTDKQIATTVNNAVLTSNGIWIADKTGLLFFDKNTHRDERVIINDKINSVNLLQDRRLLLTTNEGVYLFNTTNKSTLFIPIKDKNKNTLQQWNSFTEDTVTHTVYLGAANNGTICKLNLNTHNYEFISFQNKNINCLFLDRSRNLWVGTEGNGIYKLDIKKPKFSCFIPDVQNKTKEVTGLMVKSIYRDDSGKIWIGTFDNGLVVYNPSTAIQKNIIFPISTEDQLVGTILKDSSGSIVVTIGGSIFWLDPLTEKIRKQVSLPVISSISSNRAIIYSLAEWKKNTYIAATDDGLFTIKNENGILSTSLYSGYNSNEYMRMWMYNLCKGTGSIIYIGMRNGFTRMKIDHDSLLSTSGHSLSNISVRHFYRSTNTPILWVATEMGLVAYNETTGHYKVFDETNGLVNSSVYAILPQNDSNLWISTNEGLADLKVHYGNDTDIKVLFADYSSKDGLQSNEFNTGAFYKCIDGTFIFGGIAGINWFKPGEIEQNPYKAQPVITDIFINDKLFASDTANYIHNLEQPYNSNTISLSFRALEFTQPEQNRYAYKLDGLDKDWVYTTNDKVRYSNLPPGVYNFLLKVSNNDGLWNNEQLTIHIVIMPPYWQTWWFRSIILLVGIGIIYSIIRYYIKQKITAQTRELEKQNALNMERMRISKDVHDDLGSGLSKISLMAELAQTRVVGNAPLGNDIKHISIVSKELVDNMRDLIWVLNPENTTLEQLVSRLREYCADYLENIPIKAILDFPHSVPEMRISREAQRNIFLTVKEAINNCIKHSEANEINILLQLHNGLIHICVSDNGKGFDINQLKGSGNGLRNMKQRIESIGGSFSIFSSANNTSVNIDVLFEKLSDGKIPL